MGLQALRDSFRDLPLRQACLAVQACVSCSMERLAVNLAEGKLEMRTFPRKYALGLSRRSTVLRVTGMICDDESRVLSSD